MSNSEKGTLAMRSTFFSNNIIQSKAVTQPWFKTWFDSSYYQKLYSNRDENEAKNFIDAILEDLQPAYASKMLDLGCGNGRHSKYLAAKGFNVTGYDLALSGINEALKFEHAGLSFRQHDMRLPFPQKGFDYVLSFFTSFGYFRDSAQNNGVVNNIANALKPGGILLLDYINVQYAENHLVSVEEKEIDGIIYHINRWADEQFINKRIAITGERQLQPLVFVEQVARFGLKDFAEMFSSNGLELLRVYGDYELNDYNPECSKRLILVAKNK